MGSFSYIAVTEIMEMVRHGSARVPGGFSCFRWSVSWLPGRPRCLLRMRSCPKTAITLRVFAPCSRSSASSATAKRRPKGGCGSTRSPRISGPREQRLAGKMFWSASLTKPRPRCPRKGNRGPRRTRSRHCVGGSRLGGNRLPSLMPLSRGPKAGHNYGDSIASSTRGPDLRKNKQLV